MTLKFATWDPTIDEANSSKNDECRKPHSGELLVGEKIFVPLPSMEDLTTVVSKPDVGESCCGFDGGGRENDWEETNGKEGEESEDGCKEDWPF